MQENNYLIKDWAKDDRPREKLLLHGPEALSDSELLAILIRLGSNRKSAIELAKEVLKLGNNNLNELGRVALKKLMKIKGIGLAKGMAIAAALELGRRRQAGSYIEKKLISSSKDIANHFSTLFKDYNYEVFAVAFLTQANRIICTRIMSVGGITGTVADPRIILKTALEENAVSLVLCHNHPSGRLKPSKADEELTKKIRMAAGYLDIKLLDHVIVGETEEYFSFADEGLL